MAAFQTIGQGLILVRIGAAKVARAAQPGHYVQRRGQITQGVVSDDGRAQTMPFDPQPYPILSVDRQAGEITILAVSDDEDDSAITSTPTGLEWAVRGPLGKAVMIDPAARHVAFLAQGGGSIAPLIALMVDAVGRGVHVTLLAGAENAWRLYPSHLLPAGVRELTATDDGSAGVRAPVTHLLPQIQDAADALIASGPMTLYENLARMRADGLLTIPTRVLLYPRLECRTGECGTCAVRTIDGARLACVEGPAFDLDDMRWPE